MKIKKFGFKMKAISLLLLWGCSSKQSMIKNDLLPYKYSMVNGIQKTAPAIVTGAIYEYGSNKALGPNGAIKIGEKLMSKTNAEGKYTFSVTQGTYKFLAIGMPYRSVETKEFKLNSGDTLKLDVFLKVDERPIK